MKRNKIVYCWLADGIPFYIGIGNPKRAYTYKGRTSFSTNKRLKAERENCFEVRILHENLTWKQACELEQSSIALYGRRDLGTGILTNMTDGGEGQQGNKTFLGKTHSKESRDKISKGNSGKNHYLFGKRIPKSTRDKMSISRSGANHWNYGKTHSEETRKKIGESRKGKTGRLCSNSKPVRTPLGLFESGRQAALAHGWNQSTISKRCRNDKFPEFYYDTDARTNNRKST